MGTPSKLVDWTISATATADQVTGVHNRSLVMSLEGTMVLKAEL